MGIKDYKFRGWILAHVVALACFVSQAVAADLWAFEDFNDSDVDSPFTDYVNAGAYAPTTSANRFVDINGSIALHYHVVEGTNESTPTQVAIYGTELNSICSCTDPAELYLEWYDFFETDYPWPTSGQKVARVGYESGSFPAEQKEIGIEIKNSNTQIQFYFSCGLWGNSTACNDQQAVNTGTPMPENQVVKFGFHVKLNTPSAADGFIRLYMDDVLLDSLEDVDIRGSNTKGFNYFWIGGNPSMLEGGTLETDGSRYIDDISLYSTMPDATPTPTPTPELTTGGFTPWF